MYQFIGQYLLHLLQSNLLRHQYASANVSSNLQNMLWCHFRKTPLRVRFEFYIILWIESKWWTREAARDTERWIPKNRLQRSCFLPLENVLVFGTTRETIPLPWTANIQQQFGWFSHITRFWTNSGDERQQ